MNNNYALSPIAKNEDFAIRLKQQIAEVQKSHKKLSESASGYTAKYQAEVNEGTRKMQVLLTEGKNRGFTEEEIVESQGYFCPTVRTPILNMLYFLLREHPDAGNVTFNRLVEDVNKNTESLLNEQNSRYGSWQHSADTEKTAEKAPAMDEFIYGEMSHDAYQTIKKLKRLSTSPVEAEAFAAYTKCMEMCRKFNLEFDKIKV